MSIPCQDSSVVQRSKAQPAPRSVQRQPGEYNQMAVMGKGSLFQMG